LILPTLPVVFPSHLYVSTREVSVWFRSGVVVAFSVTGIGSLTAGVTSLTGVSIVSSAFIVLVGSASMEDDAFCFFPPFPPDGFAPSNAPAV